MSKTFGLKILLTLNFILFLGVAIVTYKIFIENKSICRDCNVVLISLDTLRQDHLGLYGYEKDTSPNLDKYSEEATVFTNAFSTSSWTLPSHASIFTSRIPSHVAIEQENMIDYKIETLVEVLREKGYYTHAFKQVIDTCYLFDGESADSCYGGAVGRLILNENLENTVSGASSLCGQVPEEYKPDCYSVIGETVAFQIIDENVIKAICDSVPINFKNNCYQGAKI